MLRGRGVRMKGGTPCLGQASSYQTIRYAGVLSSSSAPCGRCSQTGGGAVCAPLCLPFLHPPALDERLGLQQCGEYLPVEQIIPKLPVERLFVAVSPGALRLDE